MTSLRSWLRSVGWRVYGFLFAARINRRIDEEFRFHVEMRTRENISSGMAEAEARKDAVRRFGNQHYFTQVALDIRGGGLLDALWQDVRYSARTLSTSKGFSLAAVVTLALGIGANAAIFSVVHAVLLRALPYNQPSQLMVIWSSFERMGANRAPSSGAELRELREQSRLFQDVAGVWVGNGTLTGDAEPEQIKVGNVTANALSVLGVTPLLGRGFVPEEDGFGGRAAIVLSYGLWVRRYGADENILGRQVRLEGSSRTVVGVMPKDFQLIFSPDADVPAEIQVWTPFSYNVYENPTDLYFLRMFGRVAPDVTVAQAQEEASGIARQLRSKFAELDRDKLEFVVAALHGDATRTARPSLFALLIGAGLVLLISCANVANLLLTRATVRRREIALRAAIGASQWRIIRQLLIESLMLATVGGVLGLAVGFWSLNPLLRLLPSGLPQFDSVSLNPPIVAFVAAVSIISGILCGLAPSFESRRVSLVEALKGGGQSGIRPGTVRTRSLLIVAEIALGFVLIVGAGLMVRTLKELERSNPGFVPSRALTFEVNLAENSYPYDEPRRVFIRQCEETLTKVPGVDEVGAVSHLPLDDYPNWFSPFAPEGLKEEEKAGMLADYRAITPAYFQAIGARMLEGRQFDAQDQASTRNVVIVDDVLAKRTWPNESAIGKKIEAEHFSNWEFEPRWSEVVGVVEHIRSQSLMELGRGQIYIPYTQSARPHLSYVVRTKGDPVALAGPIRSELRRLDKDLAISKVRPLTDYVSKATARNGFTAALSSIFGGLALLLATIGIYGVVSYTASQRTREIGIRMALGAEPVDVIKLVVGRGLLLAIAGVVFGVIAALALTRFIESLLFGVSATDPVTYVGVVVLLLGVSVLANYLPARRATRVDPMLALRCD